MIEQGRRSIGVLAESASSRGVKLALENGQQRDYDQVLADLLAEFNTAHIGFCYDAGHENVKGRVSECWRNLAIGCSPSIFTIIRDGCPHAAYEGTIDWERFRKIFHGLGYSGNLLLEADIKIPNSRIRPSFGGGQKTCHDAALMPGRKQQMRNQAASAL